MGVVDTDFVHGMKLSQVAENVSQISFTLATNASRIFGVEVKHVDEVRKR